MLESGLIGRQTLMQRILGHLGDQRSVILLGPSGIGKTALLQALNRPCQQAGDLLTGFSWRYPMKRATLSILMGLLFPILSTGLSLAEDSHEARLDPKQITQIVEKEFPGAHIREIELETEDGRLVYEVELVTAEGHKKEMHINAVSGKIEKIEKD